MEIDKEIAEKIAASSVTKSKTELLKSSNLSESQRVNVVNFADREPVIDDLGRSYGTGGRKSASARAWIKPGKGQVIVNGKKVKDYFKRDVLIMVINQPFSVTNTEGQFDVYATVKGSGMTGQAGAVRHAISRALSSYNPKSYHKLLRIAGFITRDDRVVERKKYGQKKARKRFQFSKR